MIDDYQYRSTQLPGIPEGPFGYGGKSEAGFGSKAGSNYDVPGNGLSFPPTLPPIDSGGGGGGGGGYFPPDGLDYDLFAYLGGAWRRFPRPIASSLLLNGPTGLQWKTGGGNNYTLYFDGTDNTWKTLSGPVSGSNPKVLSVIDNVISWEESASIPQGYSFGDMLYWNGASWVPLSAATGTGTYVLASNGGTPYWLETEEC
jgi:hypothetical protein